MAGDALRDAFRTRLETHRVAAGVTWTVKDLINAGDDPDGGDGFLALEFPGGAEEQFTFGAPGANLFAEDGQVTLRVCAPIGATKTGRDLAETYAAALRARFRADRFTVGSATVRVNAVAPMGDGQTEGGLWVESVAIAYRIFNVG